jgi:hypothetical protein
MITRLTDGIAPSAGSRAILASNELNNLPGQYGSELREKSAYPLSNDRQDCYCPPSYYESVASVT